MDYLYKNWARMGLALALFAFLFIWDFKDAMSMPLLWVWLQFPIYLLHEFEEHAWPGKFKQFVNENIFHSRNENRPLNDEDIFWINIPAVWFLFPAAAVLAQHTNLLFGLFLPIFGLFNATLHLIAFIAKRKYNPGLVVSAFFNYPTGIYTLLIYNHYHLLDWTSGLIALAAALFVHLVVIGFVFTRWRETH